MHILAQIKGFSLSYVGLRAIAFSKSRDDWVKMAWENYRGGLEEV